MDIEGTKALFRINDELTAEELLMLGIFRKLSDEEQEELIVRAKELCLKDPQQTLWLLILTLN